MWRKIQVFLPCGWKNELAGHHHCHSLAELLLAANVLPHAAGACGGGGGMMRRAIAILVAPETS